MDLLSDIGAADQLSAARSENVVLQAKVKELTERVKFLVVENETLKAEVELYRREAALSGISRMTIGGPQGTTTGTNLEDGSGNSAVENGEEDWFVKSGDGTYPNRVDVTLRNLHGVSNPLCCALSADDSVLATGGADSSLRLCYWGTAAADGNDDDDDAMEGTTAAPIATTATTITTGVDCSAPVIATAFSPVVSDLVAAGCMDGTTRLIQFASSANSSVDDGCDDFDDDNGDDETMATSPRSFGSGASVGGGGRPGLIVKDALEGLVSDSDGGSQLRHQLLKHTKYVRSVAWSPCQPMFATASADGAVHVYKLRRERCDVDLSMKLAGVEQFSLHLPGSVESMCFTDQYLLCYARGTPYLSYFDLNQNFALQKINLNTNHDNPAATKGGGFDEHVSFALMDLRPFGDGSKYVAAATDANRNIVLDVKSGKQVRNLYGHKNDGYSQPKLAWSRNGQYIFGNSQDDRSLMVWDIASSQIVDKFETHTSPIRDLYSSSNSDTVVTTAYDKQTKLWFHQGQ